MSNDQTFEHALTRHRGGDLAGAIAMYRALLRSAPDADTLHYLGLAHLQLGDHRQAEVFLRGTLAGPAFGEYGVTAPRSGCSRSDTRKRCFSLRKRLS